MLHTVDEVATKLRLKPGTVREAIRVGRIPAVRLGRLLRVSGEVLEAIERIGHPLLSKRKRAQ